MQNVVCFNDESVYLFILDVWYINILLAATSVNYQSFVRFRKLNFDMIKKIKYISVIFYFNLSEQIIDVKLFICLRVQMLG